MVVKLVESQLQALRLFESSVISYGSQTKGIVNIPGAGFESSVISYGSQTGAFARRAGIAFESSVISYGSQTI